MVLHTNYYFMRYINTRLSLAKTAASLMAETFCAPAPQPGLFVPLLFSFSSLSSEYVGMIGLVLIAEIAMLTDYTRGVLYASAACTACACPRWLVYQA